MLSWTLTVLAIAIVISGILAFTGIAGTAVGTVKILFYIFMGLFLISIAIRVMKEKTP